MQTKNAHHHFLVLILMRYCNILIGSVYPTYSLVVLVNKKWLWDCNFSLGIFLPSLYSWHGFTWFRVHPTIISSFPVVVLWSISLRLNLSTLSVKNPSVKSDGFLPWWRIFFTDEIFCRRNFLQTYFFYRQIIFTNELFFLFGQYFAFCCLKTP